MTDEIYLDKIALGGMIINKEMSVITNYNVLISEIRQGIVDVDRISEYPLFGICWVNISELYDFLRHDYLKKLKKKDDVKFINETVEKYQMNSDKNMSLDDLRRCKNIILEVMSLSKFHDIFRRGDGMIGMEKINKRYGL